MQFLHPWVLWFLLALAIPILIHLFNFRKPRRLLFSNLLFLKEVQEVVQRRMKLKQWLLLFTRLLLVAFLVLLFAGPYIQTGEDTQAGARAVMIVIDNSRSMSVQDERGNYLEQARKLAYTLIQSHGTDAEYLVQTTGGLMLGTPFSPQGQALLQLDKLDYSDRSLTYVELLRSAPMYFAEASNPVHQLYFISDFQQSTVMNDTSDLVADMPTRVNAHFVPVGGRVQPNLFLSDVAFDNPLIEKDKPATLRFKLQSRGHEGAINATVRLVLEGRAAGVTQAEVPAEGAVDAELVFTPSQRGWQSGYLEVEDAQVEFDNRHYFSFYIPEDNQILLVRGDEDPAYLRTFYGKLTRQYRLQETDARSLPSLTLSDYKIIMLAGVREISPGLAARIDGWVREGGGLMVFPTAQGNLDAVNALLGRLGAGSFAELVNYTEPVELAVPELNDVLFDGVFAQADDKDRFDSPSIQRIYTYLPPSQAIHFVPMRDQTGKPFLMRVPVAEGMVTVFASFPALNWSDFPLKTSFVPVMYRTALLLSNLANQELSQSLDDFKLRRLALPSTQPVTLASVTAPELPTLAPEQYQQAGKTLLRFERSGVTAGNWNLLYADSLLEKISFNIPVDESYLAAATPELMREKLGLSGFSDVQILDGRETLLRKQVAEQTGGVPLWRYFLWAALLMLLAEALIIRFIK